MKIVKNLVDETILKMKKMVSQEIREWGVRNLMAGHKVFRLYEGDENVRRNLIAVFEHAAGNYIDTKVAAREQKRRERTHQRMMTRTKLRMLSPPQFLKKSDHSPPEPLSSSTTTEVPVREGNDMIAAEGQNTPAGGRQSEST
ncbi:hypothetical protein BT69DRAFT_1344322 [Atractiella rhizophila]|nr:hypothetical protein BT69DRAFT_1344322 [Atractiella rhizophila]